MAWRARNILERRSRDTQGVEASGEAVTHRVPKRAESRNNGEQAGVTSSGSSKYFTTVFVKTLKMRVILTQNEYMFSKHTHSNNNPIIIK